ncbi:NRDE family protein [Magnetospirillum molischianum]|uniref:NRDE family protein n=1 Tax=Magnetospirillum molischianum DSM 120 TaxID=1150626 RepID=H8FPB2_MAGML|nr:NRDE family protein [Magnetospirillum molischianum]CCG40200.1 conserved hypothetical protein [Magnetospirillum molischianum DSM 120]
MCTLVLLHRPGQAWPLIAASNRDELWNRPWQGPGRWWDDRPETVAGQDILAGGSWLGINDFGVMAAVLNRAGTLGPLASKRSRGELVLEALDHADADQAARALSELAGEAYRPFNLVIADNCTAFWLRNDGYRVESHVIPPGLHMLTELDLDDRASPRIAAHLDRFRAAPPPDPGAGTWEDWTTMLCDSAEDGDDSHDSAAMCFTRPSGFGTVSSSLIALPAPGSEAPPVWRFAPGRPDRTPFESLEL